MFRWNLRRGASVYLGLIAVTTTAVTATGVAQAADPTPEFALTFKPTQSDVEYEIPAASTHKQCKVTVERYAKGSGWVVSSPAGQVLRRFVDSNDDKVVDQWRYYRDGIEVYRDLDSDFNKKVDQMRWFNSAGSRWGIDTNEDGKIDTWKVLSPEEVSREAVRALVNNDKFLLRSLVATTEDLGRLGLKGHPVEQIEKNLDDLDGQLAKNSNSKLITPKTRWMQFQGSLPSYIPAEQIGGGEDVQAHQNAMTLVENDGQAGLVQLGTMIRVGDVWKLTRVPQPIEGNSVQIAEDALFAPVLAATEPNAPAPMTGINAKTQKLIEELQALDKKTPNPTAPRAAWSEFNSQRTAILLKLVAASETTEEREQWVKQIADGIAAGVQSETYPNGIEQLKSMLADVDKKTPQSPLVGYITYRIMTAEYSLKLRKVTPEKTAEVQEQWMKTLENFVSKFPENDDAPEAMFQLGSTYEFAGKFKDARTWYEKLAKASPDTSSGKRAAGALRRLESNGQSFELKGKTLAGEAFDIASMKDKVVVVIYWANWSEPLVKDLPTIRALYQQYHDRGLEIVGVSLDATKDEAQNWTRQHNVDWTQLYEEGGLEGSPLGVNYGIILLPTIFVVDRQGNVAYRGTAAEELKPKLADLMKTGE